MKTGIMFDLDGTLLDTLEDLADAVKYILRTYGYPEHSHRKIRSIVGNGVRNLVMLALPEDQQHRTDEILPIMLTARIRPGPTPESWKLCRLSDGSMP